MDDTLVFTKTPQGVAEVSTRAGKLSMASRRVLIMIDGKRDVGTLAPLLPPSAIDGVIAQLESLGLIQRIGGGDALDVPTIGGGEYAPGYNNEGAMNTRPATEEREVITLDEAKRRAVRELNDRLGPEAESMSVRIEHCRSVEEFRARLREAERFVAAVLGPEASQDYLRSLRNPRGR